MELFFAPKTVKKGDTIGANSHLIMKVKEIMIYFQHFFKAVIINT